MTLGTLLLLTVQYKGLCYFHPKLCGLLKKFPHLYIIMQTEIASVYMNACTVLNVSNRRYAKSSKCKSCVLLLTG